MKPRVGAYVAYGQISLAVFLALCVALHPGFVLKANEGGMSNYGIHAKTAAAYTLALGLPALFSFLAARLITTSQGPQRRLRLLLGTYVGLVILTLLSTYVYSFNTVLKDLHIVFGSALTVFESAASIWMFVALGRRSTDGVLLAVQILGFVVEVLTFAGLWHVLFFSEVLTSGAYAILLVRTARTSETVDVEASMRFGPGNGRVHRRVEREA
jgi:heme/copper-type cytochrome/quinol oxidase subunit 4